MGGCQLKSNSLAIDDDMSDETKFVPKNFWEAVYDCPLEKNELAQIHSNATAFVRLLQEEQLLEKRRKFQVEIFKIDREIERLEENILTTCDLKTIRQRFESAMASMKNKNQK
jgi:hypothetical protein